jgi:hypothetical protein
VLCRTNVGAMTHVMIHLAVGHRVALAGGGAVLRTLAHAARDLQAGRRTHHAELTLFPFWGELQDYAEHDPAGRDLKPFVDLIDEHGTDTVLAAVDQLTLETDAEVTISTAHRAKGREWADVLIAGDFTQPTPMALRSSDEAPRRFEILQVRDRVRSQMFANSRPGERPRTWKNSSWPAEPARD